jgi:hypothetical protein
MGPINRRVSISPREFNSLVRIVYPEADIIDDPRKYLSIVDAINNREARRRSFGGETEGIINNPSQFTPVKELFLDKKSKLERPAEDDQGFPLRKTWELLDRPVDRPGKEDVERKIQREVLTHLSEQAFGAPQSVRGRPTHYLNPDAPGTEWAKRTWAQDWPTWDQVGKRPVAHFFGVGKGETPPPAYDVALEPGVQDMLGSVYKPDTLPRVYAGPSGSVGRSQNSMTMAPARMPAPGPWMGKLLADSMVRLGPDHSRFDPSYRTPGTVTVVNARRRD